MNQAKQKGLKAKRRAVRTRAQIFGTAEKPRLSVKRTAKHIYAQLIDDAKGNTLAAVTDKHVKGEKPLDIAKEVGKLIGQKAKESGVETVVFDRGAYRYHGRVAALADGALSLIHI